MVFFPRVVKITIFSKMEIPFVGKTKTKFRGPLFVKWQKVHFREKKTLPTYLPTFSKLFLRRGRLRGLSGPWGLLCPAIINP